MPVSLPSPQMLIFLPYFKKKPREHFHVSPEEKEVLRFVRGLKLLLAGPVFQAYIHAWRGTGRGRTPGASPCSWTRLAGEQVI